MRAERGHIRRGWILVGCGLLLLGAALCGLDILLGAIFFPIGPEGLSPRDVAIRALTPWLWGGGALLALVGLMLLLAAVLACGRRAR